MMRRWAVKLLCLRAGKGNEDQLTIKARWLWLLTRLVSESDTQTRVPYVCTRRAMSIFFLDWSCSTVLSSDVKKVV
jgi:hypothetical protein